MQKHTELPKAFADLGVDTPILMGLRKIGFSEPSDIQRELIPLMLSGRDILGQARTGTGKTASFGIPAMQRIDPKGRLQALCLVPTRELAVQVTAELQRIGEFTGIHCVAVYGGQKIATQIHKLGKRHHFVIGTPGRLMDLIGRRILDISNIKIAILDEVDRMLDIGFRDDIRKILQCIKSEHQTVFVSATIDDDIRKLALGFSHDPAQVNVSRDDITVDDVEQGYVTAERHDKFNLLKIILEHDDPESVIVFTNTKAAAHRLAKKLFDIGVEAMEIHGDLVQRKRDRVMDRFRKHRLKVLVATDLAARGIDVHNVTHIINFDIPIDPQVYVHRIGRTARMGARGKAITFVSREEGKQLTEVERLINKEVPELTYPGYRASQPPQRRDRTVEVATGTAVASRQMTSNDETPKIRRTLGARFRPKRRRR